MKRSYLISSLLVFSRSTLVWATNTSTPTPTTAASIAAANAATTSSAAAPLAVSSSTGSLRDEPIKPIEP